MHCPRCGAVAIIGQQFFRSCGLSLEKISELLGPDSPDISPASNEVSRLRERQLQMERWTNVTALGAFSLLMLTAIVVVFTQMILRAA